MKYNYYSLFKSTILKVNIKWITSGVQIEIAMQIKKLRLMKYNLDKK